MISNRFCVFPLLVFQTGGASTKTLNYLLRHDLHSSKKQTLSTICANNPFKDKILFKEFFQGLLPAADSTGHFNTLILFEKIYFLS